MNQSAGPAAPPPKARILAVDDSPDNLLLLEKILGLQGYEVLKATDGLAALEAARTYQPDLILLDIMMPVMSGYEVCEQLKADEGTRAIPVIFISAIQKTADKVRALDSGAVDYISRPFQVAEVLARVKMHLTLQGLQDELERVNADLERRVQARTAELSQLNAALERFVPREILSFLRKDNITQVSLGDQTQQEMTVLFADLRDFTGLSEAMTPQENFDFLNDYLSYVGPIIRQHHGFIDKYLGDGLMALFPGRADDAVEAALTMRQELARFNQQRAGRGQHPVAIGIALHTGAVTLGIIGEPERWQGTVIADAVNTSARLQALTKEYTVAILASESTVARLQQAGRFGVRFVDKVRLKGKTEPLSVFEIAG